MQANADHGPLDAGRPGIGARGPLMLSAAKPEPPTGQDRFTLDRTSPTFSKTQ